MNVVRFADIDSYNQTRIRRRLRCAPLGLAEVAPSFVSRLSFRVEVVGQLNDAERKVTLSQALTPGFDHSRQQEAVLLRARFIRFALIPEGATDREGN